MPEPQGVEDETERLPHFPRITSMGPHSTISQIEYRGDDAGDVPFASRHPRRLLQLVQCAGRA